MKKGIIYSIIGVFLIGLQPIIANSRPAVIDPIIFAAITALIEALIFFPLYLFDRKKLHANLRKFPEKSAKFNSLLHGWKKTRNVKLLIIIGLCFSIVPVLLYIGYDYAGPTLSALSLKSEIIFALLFGYLFLKEKISKKQIIFSIILFFGLILAITKGSFNLAELNVGVIILIISAALFTLVHTFTKTGIERNELFSTQIVFIRNLLSGIILISFYMIFFPTINFLMVLDPINFLFFVLMGFDYGFSLFVWYKTLTYIEIGKAGIINSITPLISAFFAFIFLGVILSLFHLAGILIVIASIIIIVQESKKKSPDSEAHI